MEFLLGTHKPGWLAQTTVPLMVSHRRLVERVHLPVARGVWALDSGGFSELSLHGTWGVSPRAYVAAVREYASEIGGLRWAAIQDWMCEPSMLARTGLSVAEHQSRTVSSYLELMALAPGLPWLPVLQGQTADDYRDCIESYDRAGVDLRAVPLVGVGSVCRRQRTADILDVLATIHAEDVTRLHGFGVKTLGLQRAGAFLASADSSAWSFTARRESLRLSGHPHQTCANCLTYALNWRADTLAAISRPRTIACQLPLRM